MLKLDLQGKALDCANRLGITHSHVSISHEGEYVSAVVIFEKENSQC